jgi:hypothetical protein
VKSPRLGNKTRSLGFALAEAADPFFDMSTTTKDNQLTTTYGGIEIRYVERNNTWVFTLRGKERNRMSLKDAKDAIDAPAPKGKVPFTRTPAFFYRNYGHDLPRVDVTSIADTPGWCGSNQQYYWIMDASKKREKVSSISLYAGTPENEALVNQIAANNKEKNRLSLENAGLMDRLTRFVKPANTE